MRTGPGVTIAYENAAIYRSTQLPGIEWKYEIENTERHHENDEQNGKTSRLVA